ncbi:MAG: 50S ribosomal protein L18e [archaeon]
MGSGISDSACPHHIHKIKKMKSNKNVQIQELVKELKKLSIEQKVNFWKRIAKDLEKPTRQRRTVNVWKIDKYAKDNETVIVPGKVLGTGELNKKVNVAAFNFSDEAVSKISKNGKTLSIEELMKSNPKGKGVRILG